MPGSFVERADVRGIVSALRVYFELAAEMAHAGARQPVALEVRLWGSLRGDLAPRLPTSPVCGQAFHALRRVAEQALPSRMEGPRIEQLPFRAALYDSRLHPGTDEIYLAVRLTGDGMGSPACAGAIRRRLRSLGIAEGRWRPAAELPPEPA
jgi:hypothetical protein